MLHRAMYALQVRMAPDMLTAYVLWSAHPECEDAAQHELQSRYPFVLRPLPKRLPMHHKRNKRLVAAS